jgi:acetyl-CoA C-acetyltransferase
MPAQDAMMHDGLLDAFEGVNMVRFGADGAKRFGISREDQDAWALRSHQRAAAATDEGGWRRRSWASR